MKTVLALSLGVSVLGLVLLAAAFVWQTQIGNQAVWSEQQAQALRDAGTRYHQMTYEHASSRNAQKTLHSEMQRQVTTGELNAARDAYETQKRALEKAEQRVSFWSNVLWITGVIAAVSGGAAFLLARNVA